MKEIRAYIIGEMEKEIRLLKLQMSKDKKALKNLVIKEFEIEIDGEKKTGKTMENVINIAKMTLLRHDILNSHKNIFAINVWAVLYNNRKVEIPKKFWGGMLRK